MSRRRRARGTGVMVLDNQGVSQATTDRAMYVRLKVAYDDGHRVLTSAAVLAEVLRGTGRDATLHQVLARVAVEPVSEAIGQRAGHLIGTAGMSAAQAVDAMVAATAIAAAEQAEAAGQVASVLIVTPDPPRLASLVGGRAGVAAAHVSELGPAS